ncbi:hypothetical protein ACFYWO_10070 [Streptomyces sp. NPDC002932]|uniref:hypothetical protein n=1 Tax=Streptomyces sp. NPDC002932 TaxID=3364672 RepID=UPI0036AD0A8C
MATLRKQADVKHAIAQLFEPLLRFLNTRCKRRHPQERDEALQACPSRLAVHGAEVAA